MGRFMESFSTKTGGGLKMGSIEIVCKNNKGELKYAFLQERKKTGISKFKKLKGETKYSKVINNSKDTIKVEE